MKKLYFIFSLVFIVGTAVVVLKTFQEKNDFSTERGNRGYLTGVLNNLNQVKSAAYLATYEFYAPGDTSAFSKRYHYLKEFDNPADTTIGASFVELLQEDTTKMFTSYDGNMKAFVDWKRNYFTIDSFKITRAPFRTLQAPFFNYTKNIIKYALETEDSIKIESQDWGDSVRFDFSIYGEKQVEFFGKAAYLKNPFNFGEEISKYSIWVNKSSKLPYRVKRDMFQGISVISYKEVKLNTQDIKSFKASSFFPENIPLSDGFKMAESDLVGKVAPDWTLSNADNKSLSLNQLKGKTVLIQFTSVNCGPCRLSVSFMNQLKSEYNKDDLEIVSIESSTRNSMVLQKYQQKSGINYDLLMSTDDVTKSYKTDGVPVFYILDKNRTVRKVINGYGKGSTDKEIRSAIDELI